MHYVYQYIEYNYPFTAGCERLIPPGHGCIVGSTGNEVGNTTTIECNEGLTLLGTATRSLPSMQVN